MQSQNGSGGLLEGEKALHILELRRCRAVPWTRSCPNRSSKLSGPSLSSGRKGWALYVRFPIHWAARLPKACHGRLRSFFTFRDLSESLHLSFGTFRWTTPPCEVEVHPNPSHAKEISYEELKEYISHGIRKSSEQQRFVRDLIRMLWAQKKNVI